MPVLYRAKDLLKELPQFPLYDTSKTESKVVYTYEEPKQFEIFNEGNEDEKTHICMAIAIGIPTDIDTLVATYSRRRLGWC